LYAELHRELEAIDRRVNRTRSAARASIGGVSVSRGRGCVIRRGRGAIAGGVSRTYRRRGREAAVVEHDEPEEIVAEESEGEEEELYLEDPEYDDEGNLVHVGDYLTSSSSSDDDHILEDSSSE